MKVTILSIVMLGCIGLNAQVELFEIVFVPKFESGTRYAIVRDNELDVWITDGMRSIGEPICDFIPHNYTGEFLIYVQDYDSNDNEKDPVKILHKQMEAQDTEREFSVKITNSGIKPPVEVNFECDWDCNGRLIPISSTYLNKTIRQSNQVPILLESASTPYAKQQALKIQQLLNHYGFPVGIRYIDPSKESYNYEYHWQGGNEIFAFANISRKNSNGTITVWRYLRRIFQFNKIGQLGSMPISTTYSDYYKDYDLVFILPFK